VGEHFASTFAAIQSVIIDGYGCTGGFCHGSNDPPSGDLSLLSGVAYQNLVGVESSEVAGLLRVKPGDASMSFLYEKLSSASPQGGGSQMPLGGDPLTADQLEAVRLWIEGDAPETGTVAGTADLLGVCLP
jgi:mono/diheme cytochrome c family protein